ncbi:serine/threonine-protein kinase [Streptomyces hainanensis]|uniref:Serine/threonine protein kinase n=1 Tax=Streptomyces hainanensis TaxID=402648 RepID=A0A4V2Y4B0_9ACTN|nr:serine/threonine protein kinase [Streptomyces hainanensis]
MGLRHQVRPLQPQDPREVSGYPLRGRLGAGGMGTVYLSETRGGQPVAVKVVHAQLAEDPLFRRRFEQEVNAALRVRGRYLVPVLDSDTAGAVPWVATSYVPGPSLASAVATSGPLPPQTVLLLTAGIAHALTAIHDAGVVHRDLKPGNVLLAEDGPAVIDFGIARAADATSLTGTDVRVGTPAFMAPEQIEGGAPATPALDIFALGLTAYFAATGTHPFGEGAASSLLYRIVNGQPDISACPPGLRELIGPCLAKDPAARPTPSDIVETCRRLGETMGLASPLPSAGWFTAPYTTVSAVPTPPRVPPFVPPHVMSAPTPTPLTQYPTGTRRPSYPPATRHGSRAATSAITLALLSLPGLLYLAYLITEFQRFSAGPPVVVPVYLTLGVTEMIAFLIGALLLSQHAMVGRWMIVVAGGVVALQGAGSIPIFFFTGGDLAFEPPPSLPAYSVIFFVVMPLIAAPALAAAITAAHPSTGRWCLSVAGPAVPPGLR